MLIKISLNNVEEPSLDFYLPTVLTVREVNDLLEQPSKCNRQGLRDKAILETLPRWSIVRDRAFMSAPHG